MRPNFPNTPEILAPVGSWEMLLAAVHSGAESVYLGMPGFNARGRTKTFTIEEVKEYIEFAHLYGVKVYLAFNILIFEAELETVKNLLLEVLPLKPDALIVQDIGLIRLIKSIAPEQVIHASTQMTVTSVDAIKLTEDLNLKRYVLARELALKEIEIIRQGTPKELEIFVHGALCVSYSGQCLTSESQGGRSANRGQCAQSCRLPYELIVDGKKVELENKRYLLSPKDLCSIADIDHIINLGIDSLKIEGRLKSPEYVAASVTHYKAALSSTINKQIEFDESNAVAELESLYSRGSPNSTHTELG